MSLIELNNVGRNYRVGQFNISALDNINLNIGEGEFVSIMGPSGSGKSTLLNIIGCLDKPTSGTYKLSDQRVEKLRDAKLSDIRNKYIGFVFQKFHLLPKMSAIENVQLPLIYRGVLGRKRYEKAKKALKMVGLEDRMHHIPSQLSGGQQQRVAIARAISMEPILILADEPTGSLDSQSSIKIMELFQNLNKEYNITIIQVTHDENMALYGDKLVNILDGKIEKIKIIRNT